MMIAEEYLTRSRLFRRLRNGRALRLAACQDRAQLPRHVAIPQPCRRSPELAYAQVHARRLGPGQVQADRPIGLFALSLPFAQPHARASIAVLVDEVRGRFGCDSVKRDRRAGTQELPVIGGAPATRHRLEQRPGSRAPTRNACGEARSRFTRWPTA